MNASNDRANARTRPPFAALRRFRRVAVPQRERCEICSVELLEEHDHLLEVKTHRLLCACPACSLLFSGAGDLKYQRVPRDVRFLDGFEIGDAEWNSLLIPINMAFIYHDSVAGKTVAMYPSPGGTVESQLDDGMWNAVTERNRSIHEMQPDVQALLVNRMGPRFGFESHDYYLAPIDLCFRLSGIVRTHWHGFSGGAEVWDAIRQFFTQLRSRAVREGADV